MKIIYLNAIIASSFNGNLKYNNSKLFEHCVCLIKSESFLKKSSQIESIVRPVRKSSRRKCFWIGKWRQTILPRLCFDYVTLVDDSPILQLSIVIERVIAPIWLWKFTFHFFVRYIFWLRPNTDTQLPSNWTVQGFKMISHRMPLRYESFKVNPD